MKGSTSTIEKSGVDGRETETFDDRAREVGEHTIGHRGPEHSDSEQPARLSASTFGSFGLSTGYNSLLGIS